MIWLRNQQQRRYLNLAQQSADLLLSVINDILDISKIEAGKLELIHTDFSLRDCLEDTVGTLELQAQEKGLKLTLQIHPDVPIALDGDPGRLRQIVTNLIGNAIKFTEAGWVNVTVEPRRITDDQAHLAFAVSDTGIGIPEDKQKIIFESFKQASADTTRKFGGTGLGLAICKRLIELQGRKLELESKVGKGSKFFFTLEFKKSEQKSLIQEHAGDKEFDQLAGKKVLLAEDNEMSAIVVKKILARWGIDVEIVKNGLEAIEKVNKHDFDVILMDLHMPEMNGFEATKIIRKSDHAKIRNIPIIALTASAMSDVQNEIQKAGLNDYILKPFNPKELYNKIFMQVNK